jgi:hypothetical protein
VRLSKTSSFPEVPQIYTVSVNYAPKYFTSGDNNLTFFFNSPEGRFVEYGFNVTYNSNGTVITYSFDGVNAVGETHTYNFNLTDPQFLDTVNITYWYKSVASDMIIRTVVLSITDATNQLTYQDNINNRYNLSIAERLFVFTMILLVVGGMTVLTAGVMLGGAVTLLLTAYFGFMGFLPIWSVAIVILAGLTYLSNKVS